MSSASIANLSRSRKAHHVNTWIAILVLFILAGIGQAVSGQPEKTPSDTAKQESANHKPDNSKLNFDDLMAKIYLAYGGKTGLGKLERETTILGRQKIFTPVSNLLAFRLMRKGPKMRLDFYTLGATSDIKVAEASSFRQSTVFDGKGGWKSSCAQVSDLTSRELEILRKEQFLQPSVLGHWGETGYEFSLVGRTSYKQIPVYSIAVKHASMGKIDLFIDQRNYLLVAILFKDIDAATSDERNVIREFSEYRPVGGTMVASKQIELVDDKPMYESAIEKVEFDTLVEDSSFYRPRSETMVRLDKPVIVAAEYVNGELWIKIRVNDGEPLDFLLDSGASDTIIDRRIAAEHFLDRQGSINIVGALAAVSTQASIVSNLEIGNIQMKDVPVLIVDLMPQSRQLGRRVAGIIGESVLSRFVVTIDYAKPLVVFSDSTNFKADEGSLVVQFDGQKGPMVRGLINGMDEQSFLVDTGAALNHLPLSIAKRYVHRAPQTTMRGSGLDNATVSLGRLVVESLQMAGLKARGISFTYPLQDAGNERGGFFQGQDVGILGNPFWQDYILTIDYRLRRLLLRENLVLKVQKEIKDLLTTGDTKLIVHREYRVADTCYQRALTLCRASKNQADEAKALGRLGNLHRIIARDLKRPEQSPIAYGYFTKAQALAHKLENREIEGEILADWSLLYSDNGQSNEALATIQSALHYAPRDPHVLVDYAVHLYRSRQYKGMQKYVEKALSLDPANWQALWYQVKLSEIYSDLPRLTDTLKEILRFYPWSKLAKEKLVALEGKSVMRSTGTPGTGGGY